MSKKKKIKLEKETLMSLQEDQMKALIGAQKMSTDSGAVCDNEVELDLEIVKGKDESCCRRSCNN